MKNAPARPADTPLLDPAEALSDYLAGLFREINAAGAETGPTRLQTAGDDRVAVPTALPAAETDNAVAAKPLADIFAAPSFTTLIAVSGGMRLAIPLVKLHGIRRQPERLCRLPEAPVWVRGLMPGSNGKLRVVDTRSLLVARQDAVTGGDSHAVIVARERWALSCDAIDGVVTVDARDVRWRADRRRRRWLAGIVAGELCTLIDVGALVAWLDAGAPRPA